MKRSVFNLTARKFALVASAMVFGACYYAVQAPLFASPCANDLRGELVSPDKRYIAAYYVRDCSSSADFTTTVSIRPVARNFDFAKDVRLFTAAGICDIDVEWSKDILHIHHPKSCFVRDKTEVWRGIKVYLDAS